ncbi:MAG: hypothetical protein AB7S26_40860 [Sandaracinaceae bacterium]
MIDLVDDMKRRARALHRGARTGDGESLARLRVLPELAALDDSTLAASAKRRHALAAVARQLGFAGWPALKACLRGEPVADRGTFMHRESGGAYWNIWSAHYDEAARIRADHGGWLLGYRHQFLVVEAPFLEHLGLDPLDPDWDRMSRDWVAPSDRAAWARITQRALHARLDA